MSTRSEHPTFTRTDWQYEVSNGDTLLGYFEWVEHQVESAGPGGASTPALANAPVSQLHSIEPWIVAGESGNDCEAEVIGNDKRIIAWTANSWDEEGSKNFISDEDRANGRRIVECVNACHGFISPPETVRAMVELVRLLSGRENDDSLVAEAVKLLPALGLS